MEATPAFRPCEERGPFTTAKWICRTGNRRDLERYQAREGLAARALPLSYRHFCLAGVEPATTSLRAKYQTSSPPFGKGDVGEQARRKRQPLRKAVLLPARPAARVATPIAAGASTVRN